ncbi:hypothetical protein ACTHO0_21030 [Cytobacillus praedii]|uniref:hypothetical protein n=1 Tax=Cytobacillus praedii TaxID=1742358 RepID=UPI003F7D218B
MHLRLVIGWVTPPFLLVMIVTKLSAHLAYSFNKKEIDAIIEYSEEIEEEWEDGGSN